MSLESKRAAAQSSAAGSLQYPVGTWEVGIQGVEVHKKLQKYHSRCCWPAGAAPLFLSERALEKIQNRKTLPATYAFDLNLVGDYWGRLVLDLSQSWAMCLAMHRGVLPGLVVASKMQNQRSTQFSVVPDNGGI